ncbi:LysM peptidoglycan-binding domain-containing protein [Bacillus infantis]|uniref:LysM peptidoglycan-binding domain-containing protein n=1 Tax=Bacillus infantis TaxID=324767 RepID=UPI00101DABBE|nr:LysM peptidoglycan-binding domain-containing protein [Bacillus infantis]RYI30171.1 LysM peptidoglycan-binding domain-containing protein [Bacillus infantis]
MGIHVVSYGDTLWQIANAYSVSPADILLLNGLIDANEIVPGLALYIPLDNLPVRSHIIREGDTVYKLSLFYQTRIDSILKANPGLNPYNLQPGQSIFIPSPLKYGIQTLGFILPYNAEALFPILEGISPLLTYLAITAYSFQADGTAYMILDDNSMINKSKELGILPLLMIRNYQNGNFDPGLAGRVLGDRRYTDNLISSIASLAKEKGYSGVSIDFEFIPPPQRNSFSRFLAELKEALGNLILHVNVHAKTEDIPTNRIIGAYDYEAISAAADIVAVMTIDYGYPGGPPEPVSPLPWMEDVVKYAITKIPPGKLQIALPLYGYDKSGPDNRTVSLAVLQAQNRAIEKGANIQYDSNKAAPSFNYYDDGQLHIVWFDDIRSYMQKYLLMDRYQLLGTTFWQISLRAPQSWLALYDSYHVVRQE